MSAATKANENCAACADVILSAVNLERCVAPAEAAAAAAAAEEEMLLHLCGPRVI